MLKQKLTLNKWIIELNINAKVIKLHGTEFFLGTFPRKSMLFSPKLNGLSQRTQTVQKQTAENQNHRRHVESLYCRSRHLRAHSAEL